jgi:hypothetical protein
MVTDPALPEELVLVEMSPEMRPPNPSEPWFTVRLGVVIET